MSHEKAPAALAGGAGQEQPKAPQSSGNAAGATSPDRAAILDFLRLWPHDGHVALTAIAPDRRAIETRSFRPDALEAAADWAVEQNAAKGRNVYFSTAQLLRPVAKKAAREDVAAVPALLVDIDCRAGEPVAEELRRIAALLADEAELRRRGLPGLPTLVVCSGGGYWAFWFLAEPAEVGGDLARAEAVAARNLAIAQALDGDACHNVDRIARLPGTVNRPDAKKRAKGRTEALAHVEAHDPSRVYELAQFPEARTAAAARAITAPTSVGDHVERVSGMDDPRLARVSDRAKVVIVHGHDPEEPNRWPSRSEALYFVACEMVRAGCDDALIVSVLTDPDWGISESVLEKGRRADSYARRQVERARAEVENDAIAWINLRYFAVLEGSKVTFYREEGDGTVTPMNKEAFLFELGHLRQTVREGNSTKELEAVKLWLKHPRRRYYPRGFVLDPTESHNSDQYNLWRGFGVQPAPGDWSRMHRHIVEVLAAGNALYADYITRWTAWKLQHPATPPRVALVFRGAEGVGKGVFCNALVRAFGAHGLRVQNMAHVAGKFNAHLRHCCLLFADEAILPHDENEGSLKGMITDPSLPIEAKGRDVVHAENHLGLVLSSNNEWVIPASIGARRFAMFDVADTHKGDAAYFAALFSELENGGLAAMLHDLLAMDLGGWHPDAHRPDTAALNDQKMRSLPPLERFWLDCLMTGTLPCGSSNRDGTAFLPTVRFIECVEARMRRTDITSNAVQALFRASFGFIKKDNARPRGWEIPALAEARRRWDEARFPLTWDASETWDISAPTGEPRDEVRRPDDLPF